MGSRYDYDDKARIIDVIRSLVGRHGPDSSIEVVPIGMNALRRLVDEWDRAPRPGARPNAVIESLKQHVEKAGSAGTIADTDVLAVQRGRARAILEYVELLEHNQRTAGETGTHG